MLEELKPVPPDSLAWTHAIDSRGNVLGYSFDWGGIERIGFWKNDGSFETYFVQGTAEFPTITNRLLLSESGLVVATAGSRDCLFPAPGVRWIVRDLVDADSPYLKVSSYLVDVNARGDLLGLGDRLDENGELHSDWFVLLRDDVHQH